MEYDIWGHSDHILVYEGRVIGYVFYLGMCMELRSRRLKQLSTTTLHFLLVV